MCDYDSDDETSQVEKLRYVNIQKSKFVSGWDDENDLIEEDTNPEATLSRMILWAVNENQIEKVREILKLDSDTVLSVDVDGYTPLHRACYNNFTDIAKLLLEYNPLVDAQTEMNWTPLHSACKWSNADCAALLLQFGADVNARTEGMQTPLHVAATVSNCRNTAMTLLLDRKIDPQAENNSDETPDVIARRTGMTYPVFEMGHPAFQVNTGIID